MRAIYHEVYLNSLYLSWVSLGCRGKPIYFFPPSFWYKGSGALAFWPYYFTIYLKAKVDGCGGPFLVKVGWAVSCSIGPEYSEYGSWDRSNCNL